MNFKPSKTQKLALIAARDKQLKRYEPMRSYKSTRWAGPTKSFTSRTIDKILPYIQRVEYTNTIQVYGLNAEGVKLMREIEGVDSASDN